MFLYFVMIYKHKYAYIDNVWPLLCFPVMSLCHAIFCLYYVTATAFMCFANKHFIIIIIISLIKFTLITPTYTGRPRYLPINLWTYKHYTCTIIHPYLEKIIKHKKSWSQNFVFLTIRQNTKKNKIENQ